MLKYILAVLVALFLVGCCEKPPVLPPVVHTVYKEVKVPVKCVVPKVTCDFKGEGYAPVGKLIECIHKFKLSNAVCRSDINITEK